MAKDDFENGVWRTVGGRRIFIRDGEDLSNAMKRSGKFKSTKKKNSKDIMNMDPNKFKKEAELEKKVAVEKEKFKSEKESSKEKNIDEVVKNLHNELENTDGRKVFNLQEQRLDELAEKHGFDRNEMMEKLKDLRQKDLDDYEAKRKESGEPSSFEKREAQMYSNGKDSKSLSELRDEYIKSDEFSPNKPMKEWMKEKGYNKESSKQQGIQKLKDKLSGNKEQDEVATVKSQISELEKASGSKVKDAFQTDLFGNGKENRFILEDGTIVAHTLESFGQKRDDWSVGDKTFKSYDEVKKYLSGGSDNSKQSGYTEKQLKDVWKKEDATEIYNHLSKSEQNKMAQAHEDLNFYKKGTPAYENAKQYIEEMDQKAATKFLDSQNKSGGSNSSDDKVMSREEYQKLMMKLPNRSDYERTNYEDYVQATKDVGVREVNKSLREQLSEDKVSKISQNQAYKSAYADYKKKHPGTKLSLEEFIKYSEGK